MFDYKNENLTKEEKAEARNEFREKCVTCMYVAGAIILINGAIHSFSNPNKELSNTTNAFL